MSKRLQLDPHLPADTDSRLRRVLVDTALVTREIQAPPMLKVALESADFALGATTYTVIEFDATYHDTHGWWDTSAWRYTPKRSGYYLCAWNAQFVAPGAGTSEVRLAIQETGTTMCESLGINLNGFSTDIQLSGSTVIYCDGAASYIELLAYSAHATDIKSTLGRTQLSIAYMGDNALK